MHVDQPLRADRRGRTTATGEDEHVRDLVEHVLFTAPGERVNRPTFGSGLGALVFAPAGDAMAAATRAAVEGALQQWLGDVIALEAVDVRSEDALLEVTVSYTVRRSGRRDTATFRRPA